MRDSVDIASQWRAAVDLGYEWRACASQSGTLMEIAEGEAGGLFVECSQLPERRAYMKPRRKDGGVSRAAREKICSDLAQDLKVCVPPVALAKRSEHGGDEEHVCVSLVMYPAQWSWQQVRVMIPGGTQIAKLMERSLPQCAAAAFAFDTWVDQVDHGDHPHNMVFGYDPKNYDDSSFLFLDFSFSLGCMGHWRGDQFRRCQPAAFPDKMLKTLDGNALRATVEAIESLDASVITDIVSRIPASHLAHEEGQLIADGLVARRGLIRAALQPYFSKGVD